MIPNQIPRLFRYQARERSDRDPVISKEILHQFPFCRRYFGLIAQCEDLGQCQRRSHDHDFPIFRLCQNFGAGIAFVWLGEKPAEKAITIPVDSLSHGDGFLVFLQRRALWDGRSAQEKQ